MIDVAIADGHFKTLAKALRAAGRIDTPRRRRSVHRFTPTDDALAKLPAGTLDGLLKDRAKLKPVLTYHVVSSKVMFTDLRAGNVKTLQDSDVMVSTMSGAMVNGAKVAAAHRALTWTQQRG